MQIATPVWGERGCPLLPLALRTLWDREQVPPWVSHELGLNDQTTLSNLDISVWDYCSHKSVPASVKRYLINTVSLRRGEISDLPALAQAWPRSLNPAMVSWSKRTRNCLRKSGLLSDPSRLSTITFGDLFHLKAMGAVSVLDFACVVEAALAPTMKGLTKDQVSGLDLNSELLEAMSASWATQISAQDPRFSDVLPPGSLTIFERLEQLTAEPEDPPLATTQLASTIPVIKERLLVISGRFLEDSLSDFVEKVARVRGTRLQALLVRLGCQGSAPTTLEEAGSTISVTRERMRQIHKKFTERIPVHAVYMPQLDEAIRVVRASAPIRVDQASELLRNKGISARLFHPRSILSAADFCHRSQPFEIDDSLGFSRVVVEKSREFERAAIRVACRQADASGASNTHEVSAELCSEGYSISPDDESLRRLLIDHPELEILVDDWFWHKAGIPDRNRLRNITRKMLSVTSRISVNELREGVHRHYKIRRTRGESDWPLLTPPRAVLHEFYRLHPEFSLDPEGFVRSVRHLDSRRELNSTELVLLEVLRSSPACLLDRNSLEKSCVELGMNPNTFSQYLSSSSVISHIGTDMWSLRGTRLDPTAVEALRQANAERPNERRVIDHGWTDNGNLWFAARLPETSHVVLGIPSAIRRFVKKREFPATDEFGSPVGTVRINDEGTSYGYNPFLVRRGADAGDILLVSFKIHEGTSTLRLIDDEELESLSPLI